MTRETKIGLLVGLAFIIVIGILLSDHINSTTDPVSASMTQTFDKVEQSVNSPDSRQQPSAMVVTAPPVVPQYPVPTQRDQPAAPSGTTIVAVGPGSDPSQVLLPHAAPQPQPMQQPASDDNAQASVLPPQAQPPADSGNGNDVAISDPGAGSRESPSVPDQLRKLARANGMELVPAGSTTSNNPPVGVHSGHASSEPGMRAIKAADGDTVSKMAGRYLGANTKANRQAIINANPSMGADGHLVIAGRTYQIPAGTTAQSHATAPAPTEPAPEPRKTRPEPAAPAPGVRYYTVKDNDSLWKIASEQLGSGTRWQEIVDLNPDVLHGKADVRVNMRLKIPGKSIAD